MTNYGLIRELLIEQKMLIERLRLIDPAKALAAEKALNKIISSELDNNDYASIATRVIREVNAKYFSEAFNLKNYPNPENINEKEIDISEETKIFIKELTDILTEINGGNFLEYMQMIAEMEETFVDKLENFNLQEDVLIYSLISRIKYEIYVLGMMENVETYEFSEKAHQILYGLFCDINSILSSNKYSKEARDNVRSSISRNGILLGFKNVKKLKECMLQIRAIIAGKELPKEINEKPTVKKISNLPKRRITAGQNLKCFNIDYEAGSMFLERNVSYGAADFRLVDQSKLRVFYPKENRDKSYETIGLSRPVAASLRFFDDRKDKKHLRNFINRMNSLYCQGEMLPLSLFGINFPIFYSYEVEKGKTNLSLSPINQDSSSKDIRYYLDNYQDEPIYKVGSYGSQYAHRPIISVDEKDNNLSFSWGSFNGGNISEVTFSTKNGNALVTNSFYDNLRRCVTVEVEKSIISDPRDCGVKRYSNVISVYINGNLCSVETKDGKTFGQYSIYNENNFNSDRYSDNICLNPYIFMNGDISISELKSMKYRKRIIAWNHGENFSDFGATKMGRENYYYKEATENGGTIIENLVLANDYNLRIEYKAISPDIKSYYVNNVKVTKDVFYEYRSYIRTTGFENEWQIAKLQFIQDTKMM